MNSRISNIKTMPATNEQDDESSDEGYVLLTDVFCRRELTLSLISQLNHIIKAVARHRGISMGLLAGNKVFERDFQQLQLQLQKRIHVFESFSHKSGGLIGEKDLANLQMSWQTIRDGWQDDRVIDNFELHSHFVEQLISLVLALAKTLESPLASSLPSFASATDGDAENDDCEYPKSAKKIEVLNFACSQLPVMIEFMAKIRGLSTYCAAMGEADESLARKLRFFIDCARERNGKIRHCSERLNDISGDWFHSLRLINELETKFVYLFSLIENAILSESRAKASASQLFDLATAIIDAYWKIVEEGLYVVRMTHSEELDDWIREL